MPIIQGGPTAETPARRPRQTRARLDLDLYLEGDAAPLPPIVDLLIPAVDFWVFDADIVVVNHFDGRGDWVNEERRDDAQLAAQMLTAFEVLWERGTPHDKYQPA
jgi:hypothetical protein